MVKILHSFTFTTFHSLGRFYLREIKHFKTHQNHIFIFFKLKAKAVKKKRYSFRINSVLNMTFKSDLITRFLLFSKSLWSM